MRRKEIAVFIILGVVLGLSAACPAKAQGPLDVRSGAKALGEKIDQFGRSLMGGLLGEKTQSVPGPQPSLYETGDFGPTKMPRSTSSSRAGSISRSQPRAPVATAPSSRPLTTQPANTGRVLVKRDVAQAEESTSSRYGPTPYPVISSPPTSQSSRSPSVSMASRNNPSTAIAPKKPPVTKPTTTVPTRSSTSSPSDSRPLYQRLMSARRSAFGPNSTAKSATVKPNAAASLTPSHKSPKYSKGSAPTTGGETVVVEPAQKNLTPSSPVSAVLADGQIPKAKAATVGPRVTKQVITPRTEQAIAGDDGVDTAMTTERVLFARQAPALGVRTLGPARITVGKESAYEVYVQNAGQSPADDVVVLVGLPDWAEVRGAEASTGATHADTGVEGEKQFEWKVGRVGANSREKLVLRIVPRESRPIDLAVRVNYTPLASQAVIEVQEPKLAIRLHGPREVVFGQTEVYKLELANTGNGTAENVTLSLSPLEPGGGPPDRHQLGSLAPGKKKVIEIELTARQNEPLTVRVDVSAEGGIQAKLAETVRVLRPDIKVTVEGPRIKFVGALATYQIRLSNPGTAPAKAVKLSATLPPGLKYVACDKSGRVLGGQTETVWSLARMEPGVEEVFTLQCELVEAGFHELKIAASAEDDLAVAATTTTQGEAMADLVLEVKDPVGPVPVGEAAVYELRLQNRGTKEAEEVEVNAYFSRGIEPTAAEGRNHKLEPGQILFDPIEAIAPGESIVLKIKAQAQTAGNHMFRAEVHCKPLGTRLVGEETTHFYHNTGTTATQITRAPANDRAQPPSESKEQEVLHTATRPTVPPSQRRYGTPTLAPAKE